MLFTTQSTNPQGELCTDVASVPRLLTVRELFGELLAPNTVKDDARRRSLHRYRRIALSGITSLGSKGITLLTAIVVVPLTFRYLGAERYGLWMTITSFVLFLTFADMGVGNGLTVGIAESNGVDDHERAARLVSCAFYLLLPLSLILLLLFYPISHFINWKAAYGLQTALSSHEAGIATTILVACCLLNMPLGTVSRVQTGFQQGFVSDAWIATGNLLALVGILLAVHFGGGLPALVFAVAGIPLIVMLFNWITQFFFIRPALRPRLHLFDKVTAAQLFSVGGIFFLQQCFGLIYYTSDNLVIARTMGAVQVAHYAVLQRIFSIGLIAQYLVTPLWPAIGEAIARRDFHWASRTARRALLATFGMSVLCAVPLLFGSRYLVTRWSGSDPGPIDLLRIGFAFWVLLVGYIATMNALLNQSSLIRKHVAIFGAASIASLLLKIVFARHGSLAGVIWATDIGFGLIYIIPTLILAARGLHPDSLEAQQ